MELTEAVGVALSQRYVLGPKSKGREPKTPITDPKGLQMRMRRISDKFKTKKEAAKAAGVPLSSWDHIVSGRRAPSKKNLGKIADAFRRLVTAPAMALVVKKRGLPSEWHIWAVVVCQPNGSRYINGQPPGTAYGDIEDPTTAPEWRLFRAEGLDSGRIVGDWVSGGATAATDALLDEIEQAYGDEYGFEGDHVKVELHD
jgi:hypothetical protein